MTRKTTAAADTIEGVRTPKPRKARVYVLEKQFGEALGAWADATGGVTFADPAAAAYRIKASGETGDFRIVCVVRTIHAAKIETIELT